MGARLFVYGRTQTDGDNVRKAVYWALQRYGADGAVLLRQGVDVGAEAIAANYWRTLPDVDQNFEPLHQSGRLIEDAKITVVLMFDNPRNRRRTLKRPPLVHLKEAGVPFWRWSRSLDKPAPVGVDIHAGKPSRRWQTPRHGHDSAYDH